MKYMGSKLKIAKYIIPIIQDEIKNHNLNKYIEPFVGGANIIDKIKCQSLFASDNNRYLIALYHNIDKLYLLPSEVTKDHYSEVRNCFNNDDYSFEDWYVGAIGFLASYNGRFFDGGYSGQRVIADGTIRNYYLEAKNNLEKQSKNLKNIRFLYSDYRDLEQYIDIKDFLIYCDPPYKNTKKYGTSKNFNYMDFWEWCRKMSENNIVLISEEQAPEDFKSVWEQEISRTIDNNSTKRAKEKLFKIKE